MTDKRSLKHFKAVIFDKDGTLLDSIPFWAKHIETLIGMISEQFGPRDTKERSRVRTALLNAVGLVDGSIAHDALLAGATDVVLFTRILEVLLAEIRAEATSQDPILKSLDDFIPWARAIIFDLSSQNIHTAPLYPGVHEVLTTLRSKGLKLGLATSDTRANTTAQFKTLGLENYWDWIGCVDTMSKPKPHGTGLEEFCSQLGLQAHEVLMVGDTIMDEGFARNGGAGAFWALAEHPEAEHKYQGPDRILRNLVSMLED